MMRRLVGLAMVATVVAGCATSVDWPAFGNDPARRGHNTAEVVLSSGRPEATIDVDPSPDTERRTDSVGERETEPEGSVS